MGNWWCTYCDVGLPTDRQRDAHEDCGHTVHRVEYKRPEDDRRLQTYEESRD